MMSGDNRRDLDECLALVRAEVLRAESKYGPFNTTHEGYGILMEEVEELWEDVKFNRVPQALEEAVQVAAMGVRFMRDLAGANAKGERRHEVLGVCPACDAVVRSGKTVCPKCDTQLQLFNRR
jgi:hypothetical protein